MPAPPTAETAKEDVLSAVLRRTSLRGTVYFRADFGAPWAMDIGPKDVAAFHMVIAGRAVLTHAGGPPIELREGDVALFPHGHAHAVLHEEGARARPAAELLAEGTEQDGVVRFGGDGAATTLICGHFERDRRVDHPLFATLPACLHLPSANTRDARWMATATELAVQESTSGRAGSAAVVDRLAEVLLIQVLRAWAEQSDAAPGFLSALTDEALARAVTLAHANPARPWSVEDLARAAGLSRSAFAARFRATVGMSPMSYVTDWRMRVAEQLLTESELSMAEIGEQVGYDSEWSFAKAFKRVFGQSPGAARREARRRSA